VVQLEVVAVVEAAALAADQAQGVLVVPGEELPAAEELEVRFPIQVWNGEDFNF
jgi:hypothetical protein